MTLFKNTLYIQVTSADSKKECLGILYDQAILNHKNVHNTKSRNEFVALFFKHDSNCTNKFIEITRGGIYHTSQPLSNTPSFTEDDLVAKYGLYFHKFYTKN